MFDDQRTQLLATLDETHDKYCRAEELDWPSLYFHLKSLEAARAQDFERFAEYSYAMLVVWKMQRTGGGPRMCEFGSYRSSLQSVWATAMQLREKTPSGLDVSDWSKLKEVFYGIDCMVLPPKIVGDSKVMAHLLPNLVPPVDGGHTLEFLFADATPPHGIENGWAILEQMLKELFYPVLQSPLFQSKAEEWLSSSPRCRWDTSLLKIVDNLVWELAEAK